MLVGFIVGLVVGLIAYATQRDAAWVEIVTTYVTGPIGQIFLRLLFMLVIPLLFSALVVGISEMGEDPLAEARRPSDAGLYRRRLGDRGRGQPRRRQPAASPARASTARPPTQMLEQSAGRAGEIVKAGAEQPSGIDAFVNIIPNNLVEVMGSQQRHPLGDVLRLVLRHRPAADRHAQQRASLQRGFEGLFDVTMRLIMIVIQLAPIAVACFMFNLAALFGWDLLIRLSAYVGVVLLALGDPDVRRLPDAARDARQEEPDRLLPRDPGGEPDGLLDRLVQRDPADLAAGRRRAARAAAAGCRASS